MSAKNNDLLNQVDMTMDFESVEDLPSFELPPAGQYLVELTAELKDVNGKPAVENTYVVKEVLEVAEGAEVNAKARFSELFFLNANDKGEKIGLSFLKPKLLKVCKAMGVPATMENYLESAKGLEIKVVMKRKLDEKATKKAREDDAEAPAVFRASIPEASFIVG